MSTPQTASLSVKDVAMTPTLLTKCLLAIPLVLLAAFVAYVAYIADHMFGVVAFTYEYLAFCLLAALAFGVAWRACLKTAGSPFALTVFAVLAANFFLPPPSDRLLRTVMLKAPVGTDASAILDIVEQQYKDSPYEMPWIHADRAGGYDRIHVSLLSQKAKNCTSVLFILENGRVAQSIFSAD